MPEATRRPSCSGCRPSTHTCPPHLDCRQELATLGEPLVVVVEALQSLSAGEIDADANSRPGPIEPFVFEALEDPKMHMLLIGRSSKAVQRSNQDQTRVQLLRLCKETHLSQGLLHSLGQFLHLPHIHKDTLRAWRAKLALRHLNGHRGTQECKGCEGQTCASCSYQNGCIMYAY